MNILVTGSTGGIGKWVVNRLVEAGHNVRAMDVQAQPKEMGFEYWSGDVRDLETVRRAVYGMDAIVHLAAIAFDMPRQEAQILDTNIRGTANVLLAAEESKVKRVVSFSSINALGQAEEDHPALYLPLDDDTPHFNVHNYSLTKHLGEEMCKAFTRRGTFSAVSLRPTLVIHPDPEEHWWDFMPEEFRIQGAVRDFFSYVDVRDVAEATLLSVEAEINGHEAFLLTADDNRFHVPSAELAEKYYSHLSWRDDCKETYLARGTYVSLVNCDAAKRVLGWKPKYSQFDALADLRK